ncbi:MAG: hypothetical protein GTN81_05595 [Proteobacteria bacterium]|nr:hypothetical protein [Pseudomonadota bacterium]
MTVKAVSRGIALFVLLGIVMGFSPQFLAEAFGRVLALTTAGSTIILEGNVARARDVAIANGKRNALEVAIMEMVPEGVVFENYDVINQQIYQRNDRFIDTYRILSERTRENIYEVTLETAVVVERLKRALVTLGLLEEDLTIERSRFQLMILEVSCAPCFNDVKEYLQNDMDGVEEVFLYAISPGRFTLDILFKGDIESFSRGLLSKDFENFRLDPDEIIEDSLRVFMVVTQPEEG